MLNNDREINAPEPIDQAESRLDSDGSRPSRSAGDKKIDKPLYKGGEKYRFSLKDVRRRWPELYGVLISLSSSGAIYLGRYGYGGTKGYKWASRKRGGRVLQEIREGLGTLAYSVMENLMLEGTEFASYDSLLEHLTREGFQPETEEDERLISDLRYWTHKVD